MRVVCVLNACHKTLLLCFLLLLFSILLLNLTVLVVFLGGTFSNLSLSTGTL
jgi:hypothetical protein